MEISPKTSETTAGSFSKTGTTRSEEIEITNVIENELGIVDQDNRDHQSILDEKVISYHDQVLEYLKHQEHYGEQDIISIHDIVSEEQEDYIDIEETAKMILTELLTDVNNITAFKEAYDKEKGLNNQYELFDMSTKVQGFHINDIVMEKMAFREAFIISKVDDNGNAEPVGGLCLDIQSALGSKKDTPKKQPDFTKALLKACSDIKKKPLKEISEDIRKDLEEYTKFIEEEMKREYRKFLVHLSCQFDVDGNNAGSRITAWVDRNLHTLEEKRTEYIEVEENGRKHINEKNVYTSMGKKHYDVISTSENKRQKFCYSFTKAQDFVGEAANFILMRYLALVGFTGTFELSAVHITGALCRNIYQCEGLVGGEINNEKLDLYKIYRTVIEECDITESSCTLLTLDGRIMKHDWEGCNYVLQINPLCSPSKKKPALVSLYDDAWKYDLQLLSTYLDRKESATLKMKSYLEDHKEIGNLIKDYVQNILQIKPDNIIEFTKHFFLSYAPFLIPRAEYFEKDVNRHDNYDD
ncbi:hypothetical protein WA026_023477 [Henosepilachna vigintioctopunctata]|uniref:Ciliogenesis-associated TTC17-interacting protein N-terminal domain-containing protein n=1 Tax=Henosepilachna vigintioctopunctata TaxID=420089 RepID=A0AAW1V6T4_9CUCU